MMKIFLVFVMVLVAIGGLTERGTRAEKQDPPVAIDHKAGRLELFLLSQKQSYRRGDQFELQVMLKNSGQKDVYVFGTLDWGYSGSLMFYIHDALGKEIEPNVVPDSPPSAPPDDKSALVKLHPDHFLGTSYFAPLELVNLTKPGKYSVFAEYKSPFSIKDVAVTPFWGRESGRIRSNVVYLEVRR